MGLIMAAKIEHRQEPREVARDALKLALIMDRIDELAAQLGTTLAVEVGDRFIRVVNVDDKCVHAFIDRHNGDLIKPATFKAPQKGKNGYAVRANVIDDKSWQNVLSKADRYGGYLYEGRL